MSAGCVVIGSDTAPVREMIEDGENGLLVSFFDTDGIAARVVEALENPSRFLRMRANARRYVMDNFDMERVWLPKMIELMNASVTSPLVRPGVAAFWPGKERKTERARGAVVTPRLTIRPHGTRPALPAARLMANHEEGVTGP
jgi:hypothetical protein